MKTKIYYITRTWLPSNTGGSQMRQKQVEILKNNNFEVVVVTPNYENDDVIISDELISMPYKFKRYYSLGQRIGFYEDYLDIWVKKTFEILKNKINNDDIIFATSGGELAPFKLGTLLKKDSNCFLVVNYRDPISYTIVNGIKVDKKFHINREQTEYKYIKTANLISTSSKSIQYNLQTKFPDIKGKIINNYFGYMENINLEAFDKKDKKDFSIGYGGSFTSTQRPEILSIAFDKVLNKQGIEIYYIGNSSLYEPIKKYSDFTSVGPFSHQDFTKFMIEKIDVGFVSLQNDYFGACVPSKIYEYINLGLPILAAVPEGDAKTIIEDNGFGLCYKYDDYAGIAQGIKKFKTDKDFYNNCRKNILYKKEEWSMDNLFTNFINKINRFQI